MAYYAFHYISQTAERMPMHLSPHCADSFNYQVDNAKSQVLKSVVYFTYDVSL